MSHETVSFREAEMENRPKHLPPATPSAPTPPVQPKKSKAGWVIMTVLAVMAVAVVFIVRRGTASGPAMSRSAMALGGKPLPVVAVKARLGDIPVFIDGLLGSVTPLNTYNVIPRVTGQIMKIYFTEGQMVNVGDPLFDIDERPYKAALDAAQGQLEKDQALLEGAENDLKLYETSQKEAPGSITQQQIEDQDALVDQDKANVALDNANIYGDKMNVIYCHITSPIAGRVGLLNVTLGNLVQASDTMPLAVVTQFQPITVVFHVAEDDLQQIIAKMPVNGKGPDLQVEAFNRDETVLLATGKLYAMDSQVDPTTGTIAMKAEFDNKDGVLYPDEFVDVRLLLDTLNKVVIIPTAAVQQGPDSTFVYVVEPKTNKVDVRTVTVGATDSDRQQIVAGLQPGETVVMQGVDKLAPGMVVRPMSPQQGGIASTRPTTRETAQSASTQPASTHSHHKHSHTRPSADADGGGDQ